MPPTIDIHRSSTTVGTPVDRLSGAMSDPGLLPWLAELVHANVDRVFAPAASQVRLERLSLSRPLHRRDDRHHRELTVRYAMAGERLEKRIWLKFLTRACSRYDAHVAIWNQTRRVCDLFPEPYFCGGSDSGGVIGMERIEGVSLRTLFLRCAFARRSAGLHSIFAALGARLRAFHDSSVPSGVSSVGDLEEVARHAALSTPYLSGDEQARAVERIAAAVARAGGSGTSLPLIRVHHDCGLRNIVVRPGGSPCLLDLDALRAPRKSRWYDVVSFLINLESQIKYAPLADAHSIAAAWRSFWSAYASPTLPDGLSVDQAHALLHLLKIQYLLGAQRRSIFEVYRGQLAARYLQRLKESLLRGDHLTIGAATRPI